MEWLLWKNKMLQNHTKMCAKTSNKQAIMLLFIVSYFSKNKTYLFKPALILLATISNDWNQPPWHPSSLLLPKIGCHCWQIRKTKTSRMNGRWCFAGQIWIMCCGLIFVSEQPPTLSHQQHSWICFCPFLLGFCLETTCRTQSHQNNNKKNNCYSLPVAGIWCSLAVLLQLPPTLAATSAAITSKHNLFDTSTQSWELPVTIGDAGNKRRTNCQTNCSTQSKKQQLSDRFRMWDKINLGLKLDALLVQAKMTKTMTTGVLQDAGQGHTVGASKNNNNNDQTWMRCWSKQQQPVWEGAGWLPPPDEHWRGRGSCCQCQCQQPQDPPKGRWPDVLDNTLVYLES